MMTSLLYILLSILISIIVKAYALPIVLRIVKIRNCLYSVFTSEEGAAHSEEMLADLRCEIADYRLEGDSNEVIAARISFRLVTGLLNDLAMWAPGIRALLVGKIAGWSDTLRHYKIPNAMIAGVATLGLMNYFFFSSPNNQTIGTWLSINSIVIAMTVLIWKQKHPLARRIFNTWIGIAIVAITAIMAWLTINYRLYEIMTFKILMLAMVAVLPAVVVVDKSWRKRLFKGRWWLIIICWAPIVVGTLVGSLLIAQDVKSVLEIWAVMVLLPVSLVIVCGATTFAAYILCWLGIGGSAGGLRLVASGIRRLR
jgi:hypothetical protein